MRPLQAWTGIGLALATAALFGLLLAFIVPHRSAAKIEKADKAPVAIDTRIIRTIPIAPQPRPSWAVAPRVAVDNPRPWRPEPPADDPGIVRVPPPMPTSKPAVEPDEPQEPTVRHWHWRKHAGVDVCERTGGYKIETHGGKSWRCRYAKR